ncbi:hypothetical protein [Streptomyces sp. NPDC015131]|uniref:hypothetical protein n=1 Tax=Streptomyces sp. NPDC015131 TaxID=3364941 RepID=UPI0036FC5362
MTDLIRALVQWARAPFRAHAYEAPLPVEAPREDDPLPALRSPYGLHGMLDGAETALVRPYLLRAAG